MHESVLSREEINSVNSQGAGEVLQRERNCDCNGTTPSRNSRHVQTTLIFILLRDSPRQSPSKQTNLCIARSHMIHEHPCGRNMSMTEPQLKRENGNLTRPCAGSLKGSEIRGRFTPDHADSRLPPLPRAAPASQRLP